MHGKIEKLADELSQTCPSLKLSTSTADRLVYARDMWPRPLLSIQAAKPWVAPPQLVAWPKHTDEVVRLVRACEKFGVPLVSWGGGSGVCGGAMATQGGVIMDLKRMNRCIAIDTAAHRATFECGILGQHLEDQLNQRGFTLGHFPSSIYISTLGGWIAARSAGQMSSRYGKIEDMVDKLQVVIRDGEVLDLDPQTGRHWMPLIIGSEGTLGVITQATVRICPLPPQRLFRAFRFSTVQQGCDAIRSVMQARLAPSVVRLYDTLDTVIAHTGTASKKKSSHAPTSARAFTHKVSFSLFRQVLRHAGFVDLVAQRALRHLNQGCVMILGFEGQPSIIEPQYQSAITLMQAAGGQDLGEEPGKHWYQRRYAVSYKMSPVFASGGFADTMEIATTWDNLLPLYHNVRAALAQHAVVLAHFSHAYEDGCSIYFTFASAGRDQTESEARYDAIWRDGLTAAAHQRATLSHHHGVGLHKAKYMGMEHGAFMPIYRHIKSVVDPKGIFNPGKMGL